jgi:hypothetical protein
MQLSILEDKRSMSSETETVKKSSNAGKIVIIVATLVIIALLAVIVVLLLKGNKKEVEDKRDDVAARGVVVNQNNAEQIVDDMVKKPYVEPGYYEASMTNVWHFADSKSVSSDAYVANVEGNTNDVYFDVFLASDEENPILESPVIPRGAKMEEIKLDKELDAGTYDCVMIYHLIDENQATVSTLRVGITVIIEN